MPRWTAMELTGRCQCGAVRYTFSGTPKWCAHCHCDSCRRQTSAVFATFIGVRGEDVAWQGKARAVYESSRGALRSFCADCGSPLTYENDARWPGEMHLLIGTLDDPNAIAATAHAHVSEQLTWLDIADDLPRYEGLGGGGRKPVQRGPRARGK